MIYMIAGEASGDLLGAGLMESISEATSGNVSFHGVGGQMMQGQGMKSLFPMQDLSVMGIAEVVPQIPKLLKRIRQTVDHIIEQQPDVVVTIDSPDFCFRVVKALKKRGYRKPCVHYVAPSVWAWRPNRARKVAQFLDHILCLLPFEPPYFERYSLPATYIGHSAVEGGAVDGNAKRFRKSFDVSSSDTLLALLPGSRQGEIKRHLDLFMKTAMQVEKKYQELTCVIPTLPHFKAQIEETLKTYPIKSIVVDSEQDKYDSFAAANLALAASGTVTLELALANTPTVVSYRMSPLTSLIARYVVKTKYVSLVNLILDKPAVPELLLNNARVETLSEALLSILNRRDVSKAQLESFKALKEQAALGGLMPSQVAAQVVLDLV